MTPPTSSTHPIIPTPVPIGAVVAYTGYLGDPRNAPQDVQPANLEPQGWMVCDGRSLSCSLYPHLFAVLGFLYSQPGDAYESEYTGQLNDDATYRIPDYRGLFLRTVTGEQQVDPDINSLTSEVSSPGTVTGAKQVDPDINSFTSGPAGETSPSGIVNLTQATQHNNTTVAYIIKFA